MKQIFYFMVVMSASLVMSSYASAQYDHRRNEPCQENNDGYQDNRQQSFYYYPQSNVYYSFNTQQYIYSDCGSWVVSQRLPRHMHLRDEPRFVVNHFGFDVWNENRFHVARFRNYRYGQPDIAYAPPQGRRDDRNDNYNRRYDGNDRQRDGWK